MEVTRSPTDFIRTPMLLAVMPFPKPEDAPRNDHIFHDNNGVDITSISPMNLGNDEASFMMMLKYVCTLGGTWLNHPITGYWLPVGTDRLRSCYPTEELCGELCHSQ